MQETPGFLFVKCFADSLTMYHYHGVHAQDRPFRGQRLNLSENREGFAPAMPLYLLRRQTIVSVLFMIVRVDDSEIDPQ